MIDVNELRKGVTFELDGDLYKVLDYQHHKPGRGKAIIRTSLRNLRSGVIIEKKFISGDRVQNVRLDHHVVQYLYTDGDLYYFMDTKTYEQPSLSADILGEALSPPGGVVAASGLAPKDDVRPVADALAQEPGPVMLVGHMPFLGRLVALLICGDVEASAVRFCNGGIVHLTRREDRWMVSWVLTPEMACHN